MKLSPLLVLLLQMPVVVQSQETLVGITYNMSFPTGDTEDYIQATSFRGLTTGGRKFIRPDLSVGVSFNLHVLHETTDELITIEGGHVSGTQDRYIDAIPILGHVHYYFQMPHDNLKPFVGMNTGVSWIRKGLRIGVATMKQSDLHFTFAPEGGFMLEIAPPVYFLASLKYNYAFAAGDDYTFWGLNFGLAYMHDQ